MNNIATNEGQSIRHDDALPTSGDGPQSAHLQVDPARNPLAIEASKRKATEQASSGVSGETEDDFLASEVSRSSPHWLGRPSVWAKAVMLTTFPLIFIGGLVTTQDAGMAVPDWPGTYGYNMFLYPWYTWLVGPFDLLVEHGHRLLASLVGLMTILLVVTAFRSETRMWFKMLCGFLLLAVIGQGMLGGVRVLLNARTFAMLHGCIGPTFFAGTVFTVVACSRWWKNQESRRLMRFGVVGWLATVLPFVAIAQLGIGAGLRHVPLSLPPSAFVGLVHSHLFLAACVLVAVTTIGGSACFGRLSTLSRLRSPALVLCSLVVIQILLGCGAWICNYAVPWLTDSIFLNNYVIESNGWYETFIVTGHQATGSLIIAFATLLAVRLWRQAYPASRRSVGRTAITSKLPENGVYAVEP